MSDTAADDAPKDDRATEDRRLADEVARVTVECGGALLLGSFFLHRPDLKRVLGDRKFLTFLEETGRFTFEDLGNGRGPRPDGKQKATPFGGKHGIVVRVKDAQEVAGMVGPEAGNGTRKEQHFATGTVAARTALNTLHRVAVNELEHMLRKKQEKVVDAGGEEAAGVPSDALRVGFLSSGYKMRKKLRASYSLAPNATVMALFPTPYADPALKEREVNRVAMLFSFYLLAFLEARADAFELVDGPRDERCNQHHLEPPHRCVCNTYVRLRREAAAVPVDGEEGEEGCGEAAAPVAAAACPVPENADAFLETRTRDMLKGTNPRKGVDIAWLGQDAKIRKYLGGRGYLAVLRELPSVEVFEMDKRWKARLAGSLDRAAKRLRNLQGEATDVPAGGEGGAGAAARPRRGRCFDDEDDPLQKCTPEMLLGEVPGLVALDKPTGETTERLLGGYAASAEGALPAPHPRPVFSISRLDKETSGVLIFATSKASEEHMKLQYTAHKVGKRYAALACGFTPLSGRVEAKLLLSEGPGNRVRVHKNGKEAVTEYEAARRFRRVSEACLTPELRAAARGVCRSGGADAFRGVLRFVLPAPTASEKFTLLRVVPLTGRTHQIRVHMMSKGHPLASDGKYGKRSNIGKQQQWCERNFLHCERVHGVAADGTEFDFRSPLPDDLQTVLRRMVEVPL